MIPSVASEKSPATPLGIDAETVRLVAQCLNHYATPGPALLIYYTLHTVHYGKLLKKRPTNAPVLYLFSHLFAPACFGRLIRPPSGCATLKRVQQVMIQCIRPRYSFTVSYAVPKSLCCLLKNKSCVKMHCTSDFTVWRSPYGKLNTIINAHLLSQYHLTLKP
jgi:hypothetical protein